jgi:hypothetical protein
MGPMGHMQDDTSTADTSSGLWPTSRQSGEGKRGGEGDQSAALLRDAATGRLSVQTVERLHRLLGGDGRGEEIILRFVAAKYGAKSLLHLPANVAKEILKRPADFIQAAKNYCEPELSF